MHKIPIITTDLLLSALYRVSTLLNQSLDYRQTLASVMKVLHEECHLSGGLVTILDKEKNIMIIESVHAPDYTSNTSLKTITYKQGEGLVGSVMENGGSIVLPNLGNDPRFADKLAIYDYAKPFICVPLKSVNRDVIGVLCAQPNTDNELDLSALHKLLEMIANLLTVNIQLAHNVAVKQQRLEKERDGLKRKVRKDYGMSSLVGRTKVMREIFDQVRLVSRWDSTILIRGESGTGKEVIANAIHYNSPRANQPFVKLNCAALPDNLLESELFGHEKGAFTGAVKQRKGRFELADGGTIFLDEIGETSPSFQAKLLRVLQEKTFDRVGGTEPISVDVRVIAATNRHLEQEVIDGNFREDIYYRLNVMPIFLPPLRDRIDDIPALTEFILDKLSGIQKRELAVNEQAMSMLMSYHWPGNVRELENTIERAAVLSATGDIDGSLIRLNNSQSLLTAAFMPSQSSSVNNPAPFSPCHTDRNNGYGGINLEMDENERKRVINALEQSGWVKAKAARLLNMTPRQIAYRIQTMNIEMKQI
ncbi:nif-specific transcriptional activator NifA [Vibrio agarivorans]|uniref:nif-specific transcriptional activator NifA n=1 Tax=Vibrio agarivorans TaxID=153622 RepID=UPI00222F41BA|nr:nif-specific transcriptional activator NifA [Vibrio agarivorans]MDN3663406.1 nif-specific transcriptional activator NifA [Vibrio agarivorans]